MKINNNLWQQINDELKSALKNKETTKLNTLRMLISEVRNVAIETESEDRTNPSNELIMKVAHAQTKKLTDSLEYYKGSENQEEYNNIKSEIDVLKEYLPPQLSEQEILDIIEQVRTENPDQQGIKLMGKVMAKIPKGSVNPQKIQELLKENIVLRILFQIRSTLL